MSAPAPTPTNEAARSKQKLVRDSFTIPKVEYLVLDELKLRAAKLQRPIKKGELIRAGIGALKGLADAHFLAALDAIPSLKTGRPKDDKPAVKKAAGKAAKALAAKPASAKAPGAAASSAKASAKASAKPSTKTPAPSPMKVPAKNTLATKPRAGKSASAKPAAAPIGKPLAKPASSAA